MPIAVSICEKTAEAACEVAARVEPAAEWIEFRVDDMEDPRFDILLSSRKRPVIVACPLEESGGRFKGGPDAAKARLCAAADAGANFIDIDWRLADSLRAIPSSCRRIISYHSHAGMPASLDAALMFLRKLAGDTDIIKIVPRGETIEDALDLAKICYDGRGRIIAFAMGPAATVSRLLAIAAGAPFVYAAPAVGSQTAPGQPTLADLRAVLPPRGGSAGTAIFGVVGNPIAHSLSPALHSIGLRSLNFDAMFLAFEPREFGPFFDKISLLPFVRGLAVTAPFKEDALRRADLSDDAVRQVVAANTLVRIPDGWRALNTDDDGAADAIERGLGEKMIAKNIVVIGTGGAARAAAAGARRRGAQLAIAGRNITKAQKLAERFGGVALRIDEIDNYPYDVLVNATPAGQWPSPDESPVPARAIRPGSCVVDAVVRPYDTKLGRLATERGAKFVPGIEWFLSQAARQFRFFTGAEAPLAIWRPAAIMALKQAPKPLPGMLLSSANR
ncbi:MAG: type I 3-dehydroquinate dehydratase [Planctomycetes bacterium]|nr:type I 3-dehydroquinate dehydratase [Planctomycetota bacterium]